MSVCIPQKFLFLHLYTLKLLPNLLIDKLTANKKAVVWIPAELDAIAEELRYLAFQIRNLKNAKKVTEEA